MTVLRTQNPRSFSVLLGLAALSFLLARPSAFGQTKKSPPGPLGQGTKSLLATKTDMVQFNIASGRVRTTLTSIGNSPKMARGDSSSNISQHLWVNYPNLPQVRYELRTTKKRILVEVADVEADRIRIKKTPLGASKITPVQFSQDPSGKLTLEVGEGDSQKTFHADSLWHLQLAEPEIFEKHLVELLSLLSATWRLKETADQAEQLLFKMAEDRKRPDEDPWAKFVQQLGSHQFSKRQAAERELRKLGKTVLTYLQSLDPKDLDAEQRFRIHRIVSSQIGGSDDSPGNIAAWLSNDRKVWYILLGRDDVKKRRIAAKKLSQLLGRPIDFDPDADEKKRSEQTKKIKAKIFRSE